MVVAVAIGVACVGHSGWIYAKAIVAQRLIGSAWNRVQAGDRDAKPWWWADTHPIAKLTIGRDGRELMVLEGSSGRNLAFGPTHDPASVPPGERGNSVIDGHRDTHFAVLKDLKLGDVLSVELPDGRHASFTVVGLHVADSRRSRISLDSDIPRLTLVTCYPFDAIQPGGPLRYVVTADSVAPSDAGVSGSRL
jgi:sortase A